MNLFLIGLPGSGKSTLGRELAQQLNLKMVDTDAEIVATEGKTIEAIFRDSGEDYFRKLEQSILHKLSENDQQLISTGGGMPCFFDNMEHMKKKGITLFINVPVENLHQRLIGQRSQSRPMLEGKTDEEVLLFLKQKYEERFPYYSKALITIKGSNIKVAELISELEKRKFTN
ncbi:MAG TPA: shikimate kinase [Cytophagaceae bacterium]|jgi:shikimate kinase|nr:shikimate kinase [Cytophagaceae bacterium]